MIQASLDALGKCQPIVRPPWLTPSTVDSLVEDCGDVVADKLMNEEDSAMQVDEKPVIVACPGLRSSRLPDIEPHFSILNPDGHTSYGPSGKRAENFENNKYQMPYYPAPTLHGLMMVLNSRTAASVWCSIGEKYLSKQLVALFRLGGIYLLKRSQLPLPYFFFCTERILVVHWKDLSPPVLNIELWSLCSRVLPFRSSASQRALTQACWPTGCSSSVNMS